MGTADTLGSPALETVGCLGRIIQHERLSDGRFNVLLLGRKRVRLTRELPSTTLYRIAEAEMLDDDHASEPEEPRRSELIRLFCELLTRNGRLEPELAAMLENP